VGGKGEGRGKEGVMTQSLYAHINKGNKKQFDLELFRTHFCSPAQVVKRGLITLNTYS
jgi:hypothetical protein